MTESLDNVVPFPNLVQLYLRQAALALQEENLDDAIRLLDEVIDLDPKHEEAKQLRDSLADQLQLEDSHKQAFIRAEISADQLEDWKKGILQTDLKKQWQTFEQMHSFIDEGVFAVLQQFLLYAKGDPLLKTKIVQQCKLICPGSWSVEIEKRGSKAYISLSQVPVELGEWDSAYLKPLELLQDIAYRDPSLVEMSKEAWLFYLERSFPFIPEIEKANKWTAALHYYTLRIIHEEIAANQLQRIAEQYNLSVDEVVEAERQFYLEMVYLP
ncbi:hypothetical protein [Bacillus horti]|nr:hypothetical protein [Bacillus horti]